MQQVEDYNLPRVRRLLPGRDLTRRGVRFVNRRPGSGTRVLLDELLKRSHSVGRSIKGTSARRPDTWPWLRPSPRAAPMPTLGLNGRALVRARLHAPGLRAL